MTLISHHDERKQIGEHSTCANATLGNTSSHDKATTSTNRWVHAMLRPLDPCSVEHLPQADGRTRTAFQISHAAD